MFGVSVQSGRFKNAFYTCIQKLDRTCSTKSDKAQVATRVIIGQDLGVVAFTGQRTLALSRSQITAKYNGESTLSIRFSRPCIQNTCDTPSHVLRPSDVQSHHLPAFCGFQLPASPFHRTLPSHHASFVSEAWLVVSCYYRHLQNTYALYVSFVPS